MAGVSRWPLLVAAAVVLGAVFPAGLSAQFFSFGQNKIQYRKLDWRILRGPHVDLYYYPAEADLAPAALAYAEASYDTLAVQFGSRGGRADPPGGLRLPHGFRADQHSPSRLGRAPGRNRFSQASRLLPFRGNFAEFRHTLRHELVHVFQLDLLNEAYYQAPATAGPTFPCGGRRAWPSSGPAARTRVTRWSCATSPSAAGSRRSRCSATSPAASSIRSGRDPPLARGYLRRLAVATMYKELNRHDNFNAALLGVYGRTRSA